MRNQNTHQLRQHGFVRDSDGKDIVIHLGRDEQEFFMLNAALIAKKFHLIAPTRARFEYLGPLNMFLVTFLHDENDLANNAEIVKNVEVVEEVVNNAEVVQQVVNNAKVLQEVIDISSDEEVHLSSDEKERNEEMQEVEDLHHFEQKVIAAMSRTDKERVLVHLHYRIIKNMYSFSVVLYKQTF